MPKMVLMSHESGYLVGVFSIASDKDVDMVEKAVGAFIDHIGFDDSASTFHGYTPEGMVIFEINEGTDQDAIDFITEIFEYIGA